MAKGDVISAISDVEAAGNWSFQPAAGVEIILLEIGTGSQAADMKTTMFNGTTYCCFGADAARWSGKFGIGNVNYLRLGNANAAVKTLGYLGVQIK